MLAAFLILVVIQRAIAEAVWWLGRRDRHRSRSQQMADIARLAWAAPLQWPIGITFAAIGVALALVATAVVLSNSALLAPNMRNAVR